MVCRRNDDFQPPLRHMASRHRSAIISKDQSIANDSLSSQQSSVTKAFGLPKRDNAATVAAFEFSSVSIAGCSGRSKGR
jgi:hypothetical protein